MMIRAMLVLSLTLSPFCPDPVPTPLPECGGDIVTDCEAVQLPEETEGREYEGTDPIPPVEVVAPVAPAPVPAAPAVSIVAAVTYTG